jgi:hypothetical protein
VKDYPSKRSVHCPHEPALSTTDKKILFLSSSFVIGSTIISCIVGVNF